MVLTAGYTEKWLRDPFQCTGLGILVTCLLEDYTSDIPFATDFEMKCQPYVTNLSISF